MRRLTRGRTRTFALLLLAVALVLAGCGGSGHKSTEKKSKDAVNQKVKDIPIVVPTHFTEIRNINLRTKIADDPSTILWCTFYPPMQLIKPFTVPIAGKLTSSNKRLWATERGLDGGGDGTTGNDFFTPEVRAPDGTFGPSADYRYGFDPTLAIYSDFTDLPSFCTTNITQDQFKETNIEVDTNRALVNLTQAASAAIRAGNPQKSLALLKQAEALQDEANRGQK